MKNNLILNTIQEKCPNCGIGNVFDKPKKTFSIPETKKQCNHCQLIFDREPGFFIGAMYVSYGLAVFQAILTFLIMNSVFPNAEVQWQLIAITVVLVGFSFKNYKWARIIYIRIFSGPKGNKK